MRDLARVGLLITNLALPVLVVATILAWRYNRSPLINESRRDAVYRLLLVGLAMGGVAYASAVTSARKQNQGRYTFDESSPGLTTVRYSFWVTEAYDLAIAGAMLTKRRVVREINQRRRAWMAHLKEILEGAPASSSSTR